MGEKESRAAAVEARRDLARRGPAPVHADAIGRYLASVAYETAHDRNADGDDEEAQQPKPTRGATKAPAQN